MKVLLSLLIIFNFLSGAVSQAYVIASSQGKNHCNIAKSKQNHMKEGEAVMPTDGFTHPHWAKKEKRPLQVKCDDCVKICCQQMQNISNQVKTDQPFVPLIKRGITFNKAFLASHSIPPELRPPIV